jgi:hypothetical protein
MKKPATTDIAADLIGAYCVVRTYSAGVFAGTLKARNGREAVVTDARRLWYWDGAASLSQLATEGTARPENCKFPPAVPSVFLAEVIEITPCSEAARASIEGVKAWKA